MKIRVAQLATAQALMMSVNTLLLTSSAIIGEELATDKSLATLPLALQFFAIMLTTIPASMLMKRIGRRAGFIFCSVIGIFGGISSLYGVIYESFVLFCLGTSCVGIYTGFGNYFRFAAAEIATPETRGTAISYVLAGGVIAAVLGPNLANLSKDILPVTYTGNFVGIIILYALNLINFSLLKLPMPEQSGSSGSNRKLITIASQPVYIVAVVSAAVGYAIMILLMTATPLVMTHRHHNFTDVAFVIQWHVLGMYVPSFFTGHLISLFSALRVIKWGAYLMVLCVFVNLNGSTVEHFWVSLTILGIAWNFMFIGGTTLLTDCYAPAEAAKAQALNDFIIFTSATAAAFGAGALEHSMGWELVNVLVIPFIFISIIALATLNPKTQAIKRAKTTKSNQPSLRPPNQMPLDL